MPERLGNAWTGNVSPFQLGASAVVLCARSCVVCQVIQTRSAEYMCCSQSVATLCRHHDTYTCCQICFITHQHNAYFAYTCTQMSLNTTLSDLLQEESASSPDAHAAQGLADASTQLMQSLDNLLGSLEVPTADTPDHADLQQQQHDDHEWVPNQQSLQADAEPEVELSGRATPGEEGEDLGTGDKLWTSQHKPDCQLLI